MKLTSLFLPHGAPTFALSPGPAGEAIAQFAASLPRPEAILIVSGNLTHNPFHYRPGLTLTPSYAPEFTKWFGRKLGKRDIGALLDYRNRPLPHPWRIRLKNTCFPFMSHWALRGRISRLKPYTKASMTVQSPWTHSPFNPHKEQSWQK